MVADLRAANKVIQPMDSLQSGIPLPSLLPKGWSLIVIDLKGFFSSLYLYKKKRKKSAFTVTTYNNFQPVKRYLWKILPQGMLNSPTLCQYFIQHPLEVVCKQFCLPLHGWYKCRYFRRNVWRSKKIFALLGIKNCSWKKYKNEILLII